MATSVPSWCQSKTGLVTDLQCGTTPPGQVIVNHVQAWSVFIPIMAGVVAMAIIIAICITVYKIHNMKDYKPRSQRRAEIKATQEAEKNRHDEEIQRLNLQKDLAYSGLLETPIQREVIAKVPKVGK